MNAPLSILTSHVVDVLGTTAGRDQPIMVVKKAFELLSGLDPASLDDDNTVFLDPFCKAGEILLAAALALALSRSKSAKADEVSLHISKVLTGKRCFALATDERHYLLSKRTFYGNRQSHVTVSTRELRNGAYLSPEDGKLDSPKFAAELASMIQYIQKSKGDARIVVVGNPPYQEADGGAKASARPIYNFFVEQLLDSPAVSEFCVVIPARWFSGGKGLSSFRDRIAKCGQVQSLQYFDRAEDVFPTVHIQGGVCFLHVNKAFHGVTTYIYKGKSYAIELSRFDIILDDPMAGPLIQKVLDKKIQRTIASAAWSAKPFGLRTNHFKKEGREISTGKMRCLTKGRKWVAISPSEVATNKDKVKTWKVVIPAAYATGARRCTLPAHQIFKLAPNEICTETYNIIDTFDTEAAADRLIVYLRTNFSRYLLGLRKLGQHITKDRWLWVPYVPMNKNWTDESLFEFFGFTQAESAHVIAKVQEW